MARKHRAIVFDAKTPHARGNQQTREPCRSGRQWRRWTESRRRRTYLDQRLASWVAHCLRHVTPVRRCAVDSDASSSKWSANSYRNTEFNMVHHALDYEWHMHIIYNAAVWRNSLLASTNDIIQPRKCCIYVAIQLNRKLRWCWQTRETRLEVSQGHQT